jgi:hypothetical protein
LSAAGDNATAEQTAVYRMEEPNSRQNFIPLDAMEERDLRRILLQRSRAGDAVAQATLFELYGVTVTSPTEPR